MRSCPLSRRRPSPLLPQQNPARKRRGQGFVVDEKILKPCVVDCYSGSNGSAVGKRYRDLVGVIALSGKQPPGPLEIHQSKGRSRRGDGPSEVEFKGRTKRALRPAALARARTSRTPRCFGARGQIDS